MGRISINGMRFYAHHGCFEQERAIGTHFVVDVSFLTDTTKSQISDDLHDTVNYLEVYQSIRTQMMHPSHLLEHVANRIGETILHNFPGVQELTVTVHKLNPPLGGQMDSVSVELTFSR